MHPLRRRKLISILCILAGIFLAIALVMYALRQNISLFYTPSQLVQKSFQSTQPIRVGGMVVKGSIQHLQGLDLRFELTDYQHTIPVYYHGILPDLFREGQGIVAKGLWTAEQRLQASDVLAKHDENYMPPELKAMTDKPRDVGIENWKKSI